MSRFNTGSHKTAPAVLRSTSPLATTGGANSAPDARTFNGARAWSRTARTDLFIRATSSFHSGGDAFYESGAKRDTILCELAAKVAVTDFTWFARFCAWTRGPGNIRTAALMMVAEGVHARLEAGEHGAVGADVPSPDSDRFIPTNRSLVASVLQRADEPGEFIAYWTMRFGRNIPKAVKRGVADAVRRLYHERSLLKYDTGSHPWRFADVLELCHPSASADRANQGDLFKYAIDRRHGRGQEIPESLSMLVANADFRRRIADEPHLIYNQDVLRAAGLTWEDALSLSGTLGVDKARVWDSIIPSMGYMALLRNLRNFDEAGISQASVDYVKAKLANPDEVAKSRQLPFRFYSAFASVSSVRWAESLEKGLNLSLANIPELTGRSLILIDSSGSMRGRMSDRSTVDYINTAALFGSALALKNNGADLWHFADRARAIPVPKGGSVLPLVKHIVGRVGEVGYGTNIPDGIRQGYKGHDRVIILSDMQTGGYFRDSDVPADIPVYCFNLAGYSNSPMPTGGNARFDLAGLTDRTFAMIRNLEAGRGGAWPWELDTEA